MHAPFLPFSFEINFPCLGTKYVLNPGGMMRCSGVVVKKEEGHFVPVTGQAVDRHFSKYFDHGEVFPIQMVTGISFSSEGLKETLRCLKKVNKVVVQPFDYPTGYGFETFLF